jgi:hypothetical protein
MPSKEQTNRADKETAKQRSARPEVQNAQTPDQPAQPAATIQQARLDPRSLTPRDILYLQRTIGNRAVVQLLAKPSQPQPAGGGNSSTDLLQLADAPSTAGSGPAAMPGNLQAGLERLSGMDLSHVRVHRNSSKPAQLQALAYTRGDNIYLGPGQEQSLPHEGWHVVQQRQGQVKPGMQLKGLSINNERSLEREADAMGAQAAQLATRGDMSGIDGNAVSSDLGAPGNEYGILQFKGWKVRAFLERLLKMQIPGVCNAMSAAWLTDLIEPEAGDDTVGVDETNIEKIKLLKQLLDMVVGHFNEYGSNAITFAFVDYFKERGYGSDWLDSLTKKTIKETFEDFKDYVRDDWEPKKSDFKAGQIEGLYDELAEDKLYVMIDDVLEPFFDMRKGFRGVVTIKAEKRVKGETDYDSFKGHEMAIRYNPEGYVFQIFDQNGGLTLTNITEQEEIAEKLAHYLHSGYIAYPIEGTNYAKFWLDIHSK